MSQSSRDWCIKIYSPWGSLIMFINKKQVVSYDVTFSCKPDEIFNKKFHLQIKTYIRQLSGNAIERWNKYIMQWIQALYLGLSIL